MKNVLSQSGRVVLEELAWSNVLLAFDYDGTLAPSVADSKSAILRLETRELLKELGRYYQIVVISERSQSDAQNRLRGAGIFNVIGNQGRDSSRTVSHHAAKVRRWLPQVKSRLESFKGVTVEGEAYSLSINYKLSREKKKAKVAILKAAAALKDVRLIEGKQGISFLPNGAPHRGVAVERALAKFRCDTALYVGNDEADEEVFSLDQPGRLLTIRVGLKRTSAAAYYVETQRAVDDLLRILLGFRNKWE